jgi:pectate lyase
MEDKRLLNEYVCQGSEGAFQALVARHMDMVYSTSLRQTRDTHLAEDVSQAVFIILAKKARTLVRETSLSGWLFKTAKFACSNAIKKENRSKNREREAETMYKVNAEEAKEWQTLLPFVDETLLRLRVADRNAVLLRYFENKSFKDVGHELNISEEAAKKRVARAVEKLRLIFSRKGITVSGTMLAGHFSTNAIQTAPAGLAGSATKTAMANIKNPTVLTKSTSIAKGAMKTMMWAKIKSIAVLAMALATIGTGGTLAFRHLDAAEPTRKIVPVSAGFKAPAIPAFPGAEGFGAASKGGRGGRVIKVTNLNAKGPGSLQWACNQPGPRIVVFDVSGVIKGNLKITNGQITIAGQTAPGAGITIDGMLSCAPKGMKKGKRLKDVIVRFLRIRPRPRAKHGFDAVIFFGIDHLMVDHVSASWGEDETLSLTGCANFSMQWCAVEPSALISEGGVVPHNFGTLIGYTQDPMGIHHTLYAHHFHRTPAVSGKDPGIVDLRNNVIYNVAGTTYLIFKGKGANMVGCYHKEGPGGSHPAGLYQPPPAYTMGGFKVGSSIRKEHVYLSGNYSTMEGGYLFPQDRKTKKVQRSTPLPFAPVKTHVAEQAYELVLAQAGCLPRDEISKRTTNDVRNQTGSWGRNVPREGLMSGLKAGKAATDTDNDGMSDEWEKAHQLNSNDASDANKIVAAGASPGNRHKGYTYIEYFINEKADRLIADAVAEARKLVFHGPTESTPLDWASPLQWKKTAPDQESPKVSKLITILGQEDQGKPYAAAAKKWNAARYLCYHEQPVSKESVKALVGLLKHKSIYSRRCAAWVLGCMNPTPKEAAPALIESMLDNEQKKIKGGGGYEAWALGQIGPKAAKQIVPALTKVKAIRAKAAAAYALIRMGADAEPAIDYLLGLFDGQDYAGSKYCAAKALARIGEPAIPTLIKTLEAGKTDSKAWAARALGWMGAKAKSSTSALLKTLANNKPSLQQAAAKALALIGQRTPTILSALSVNLKDPNWIVRYETAKALSRLGSLSGNSVTALKAGLSDKEHMVRAACAKALGRVKVSEKSVASSLSKILADDPHDWPRFNAARALGRLKDQNAIKSLSRALLDKDCDVRAEAAWALLEFGSAAKSASAALEKAVKSDRNYIVQYAAAAALKKINDK